MGSRSKKLKLSAYPDRARTLKILGILPTGYKPDKLNESQKRHIRRIERSLKESDNGKEILRNPDAFASGPIPAAAAKSLKGKGYTSKRSRGQTRIFVRRDHAKRISWDSESQSLIRHYGNRRSRVYPLDDTNETRARLREFFHTRKRGEYLTLQVGDNNPFRRVIYSLADFEKYLEILQVEWETRSQEEKDKKGRDDNPAEMLQVVEMKRGK